jgi:ABC-type nitrate/sulfonate/bicarbonate transport system permease component
LPAIIRRTPAGVISTIIALLIWQFIGSFGPLAGDSFATASEAITALIALVTDSVFWAAVGQTLQMAVLGFVISIVVAVPLGLLIGLSRFSYRSTKFTFDFFKVIPPIVIIPIAILAIGPNIAMGVVLVIFANVFAVAIQTAYGVRDTDPVLLETMRCYRFNVLQQVLHARLPSAAPQIAVAIRLAASAALIVAVVAGLVGGAPGLGNLLMRYQSGGQVDKTYAVLLALGIFGILVSRLIVRAQRRIIFWTGR